MLTVNIPHIALGSDWARYRNVPTVSAVKFHVTAFVAKFGDRGSFPLRVESLL